MQAAIDTEKDQAIIKYNVLCLSKESGNFKKWAETLNSVEMRHSIVEDGYAQADAFLLEHLLDTDPANASGDLLACESTIHELD